MAVVPLKSLAAGLFLVLLVAALLVPVPRGAAVIPSGWRNAETDPPLRGASDLNTTAPSGRFSESVPATGNVRTGAPPTSLPSPGNRGAVSRDPREAATTAPSPSRTAPQPRKVTQRVYVATAPRTQSKYGVPWLVRQGLASHMGPRFPAGYLALPHGPGWRARICGAGGCVEMVSNDAGPDLQMQREGRIADLSVYVFEKVCGVPSTAGLCQVSVTIMEKAR